jgi:hypothetical protein
MDNKERPTWSKPPERHDFRPANNNRRNATLVALGIIVALVLLALVLR